MRGHGENVPLTWFDAKGNQYHGVLAEWEGPTTVGSHLGFSHEVPDTRRCPCGWYHKVVNGEVRSWGLAAPSNAPISELHTDDRHGFFKCAVCGHVHRTPSGLVACKMAHPKIWARAIELGEMNKEGRRIESSD